MTAMAGVASKARGSERPANPRADISTAIVLARHNNGVAMMIESISTSGARLVGPVTLIVGERIQALFDVEGIPVEVFADVVRVETQDIATDRITVRFVDVSDEKRAYLQRLVHRRFRRRSMGDK
jgi:hypothetical protein